MLHFLRSKIFFFNYILPLEMYNSKKLEIFDSSSNREAI